MTDAIKLCNADSTIILTALGVDLTL